MIPCTIYYLFVRLRLRLHYHYIRFHVVALGQSIVWICLLFSFRVLNNCTILWYCLDLYARRVR
ncbi:hypothetical protein ALC56_02288 [Trachymyrmex septentrionalis]|uniref:Uncharacterized protein n=1 Tax=Trachymyrmex septentrionalis TaxID=34720 RepID=A0A195FRV8_9HYME|nr:hypothetical protein ALC56_02288 [Trachymyrmex septentrionalis]